MPRGLLYDRITTESGQQVPGNSLADRTLRYVVEPKTVNLTLMIDASAGRHFNRGWE
jgi:hypothetical protein